MTHAATTLLALVLATHTFVSVQALRCWSCTGVTSQADCTAHGHMQSCASNEESCESEIRRNNGQYQITRMCKQRQACENNRKNNVNDCKGPNPVCRYCCTADLCNKNVGMEGSDKPSPSPVPPRPSPTPVPKSNRCKHIQPPKFGRKTCNFNGFPPEGRIGSKCTFMCNQGYVLQGKMMSFCEKKSPALPPTYNNQVRSCKKAPSPAPRCTALPKKLENGKVKCPGMGRVGTSCTFTCDPGFRNNGDSATKCVLKNGRTIWESKTAECIRNITRCSALPPSPPNGRRTCSGTGEIGTACEFICNAGFEISGHYTTICVVRDGRATWEPSTPVCRLLQTVCNNIPEDASSRGFDCDGSSTTGFTSCQIFCKVGFKLKGPSTIQCITRDGGAVWNSQPPYCVSAVVGCAEFPPTPDNGQRVCDGDGQVGTRCEYSCDPGLKLFGKSSTKCVVINGKAIWEPAVPKCKIIKNLCKVPSDNNVEDWRCRRDSSDNTVCEFSCKTGFVAVRETVIRCDYIDGREVWEANPPYCAVARCATLPPRPPNGRLTCSGNGKIGTACEFICDAGFEISGHSRSICLLRDGRATWEFSTPVCRLRARCTTLPRTPENGHVHCASLGRLGTSCEFSCNTGFVISGSSTTTCIVTNGKAVWESETPECNLVSKPQAVCDGPEDPAFSRLVCDGGSETGFTSCQLFCKVGFQLKGPSTIKCITRDGRAVWNSQPSYCVSAVVGCADFPPTPDNGQLICDGDGEIGTRCEYLCDPGLKLIGDPSTECVVINGKAIWRSPVPKCEVHKKGPLCKVQSDKNVEDWSCHSDPGGNMVCEFTCRTGFVAMTETIIRCNYVDETGVWEAYPPYCTAAQCPAFTEAPANGRVECTGAGGIGTTCEFSCHPGYKISGLSTSTCTTQNGTTVWESPAPSCERTTPLCELPNAKPFTRLKCNGVSNGYTSCNISCLAGYESRLSTIHCVKRDGRDVWDLDTPYCKPVSSHCSALPTPLNGGGTCSGNKVGSMCGFYCYTAFTMFGFSTSACVLQNGMAVWEPATPICRIRHRESACKLPKDAEFTGLNCENDAHAGLSCTFSCRRGFKPRLSSTVDCTVSEGVAFWSSDPPYCTSTTIAETTKYEYEIHTFHN